MGSDEYGGVFLYGNELLPADGDELSVDGEVLPVDGEELPVPVTTLAPSNVRFESRFDNTVTRSCRVV